MRHPAGVAALMLGVIVAGCGDESDQVPLSAASLQSPVVINEAAVQSSLHNAHLTGADEVPPTDSRGQGQATFQLSRDGESLQFRLNVANIENVTQAHIHLGPADGTGPVVAWLYPDAPPSVLIPGRSQGTLGSGTITATELMGPLAGMTLADLVAEIEQGNTYVNVHTTQYPPGEIRGQID